MSLLRYFARPQICLLRWRIRLDVSILGVRLVNVRFRPFPSCRVGTCISLALLMQYSTAQHIVLSRRIRVAQPTIAMSRVLWTDTGTSIVRENGKSGSTLCQDQARKQHDNDRTSLTPQKMQERPRTRYSLHTVSHRTRSTMPPKGSRDFLHWVQIALISVEYSGCGFIGGHIPL